MEKKRRFGAALRALRKQRGLTHEQLAELLERSVDAVSRLERGKTAPSFDTLTRISVKLGVPLETLTEALDDDRFGDPRRIELEVALFDIVRTMPMADLELAVDQIKAIAKRTKASS